MVGNCHAMRVAGQVVEHVFWSAEWRLSIHHPVLMEQLAQKTVKSFGVFQSFELSEKAELLLAEKALQPSDELTAKNAAKYLHGEEEMVLGMDPARVVCGKASGRYDAMHVGMSLQVLSPGVEHAQKANIGAEMLRIGGDLRQRLSAGLKQQVLDDFLVL